MREAETLHLYILAGQSNMDGMGFVSDLPKELRRKQEGAWIYNPNRRNDGTPPDDLGYWERLKAGQGYGHHFIHANGREQAVASDRFGPELTFARTLRNLRPGHSIALLKYARGGSSIHPDTPDDWGCWDPDYRGINQWTHFVHHYRRATTGLSRTIGGRGNIYFKPAGIIWQQGESDAAYTSKIAAAYRGNLENVIGSMRELTGEPNLPVVIGQISADGQHGKEPSLPRASMVQLAQQEFAANDEHAALVPTPDSHGWLDAWHYSSATYLEMGKRFARAMAGLLECD